MKRFLGNIALVFAALLMMAGCAKPELVLPGPVESGEGLITLTLKNGSFPTRTVDALDYEKALSHVDIILFKADGIGGGPGSWAFHTRVDGENLDGQTIVLGKRTDFAENTEYWVYVLANHVNDDGTDSEEQFKEASCGNFLAFCQKTSSDELVFLTGHTMEGVTFPKYFLMDGVAYITGSRPEKDVDYSSFDLCNLYEDPTKDVRLTVDLRRAVAKVKVNILEKAKDESNPYDNYVEFTGKGSTEAPSDGNNEKDLTTSGFYFRNLPYSTSLIADSKYDAVIEAGHEIQLRNTVKYNGERFNYFTDNRKFEITAYAYARDWHDLDAIESTTIVANVPLKSYEYSTINYGNNDQPWVSDNAEYADGTEHATLVDALKNKLVYRKNFKVKDDTGKDVEVSGWFGWSEEVLNANYYQIPISQSKALKRNGYYEVTVTISIPGGSEPGEPVKLDPISYEVYDWKDVDVNIGNSTERPAYLALNKEEFEMYNIESDYTLEFASSEDVTVEVVNYYFVDKLGQRRYGYDVDDNYKTIYPKTRINTNLFNWEQIGTEEIKVADTDELTTPEEVSYGILGSWGRDWTTYSPAEKDEWLRNQGVPEGSDDWDIIKELGNGIDYTFKTGTYSTQTVPVYDDIKATPDPGMSGNIKVVSPMPENNTIRYIELLVRNDNGTPNDTSDDLTRTVTIKQYPLVYITNTQSWYSYRSDFIGQNATVPTTYETRSLSTNNNVVGIAYTKSSNSYTHLTSLNSDGFWFSKYASSPNTNGYSTIYLYSRTGQSSAESGSNARMYHVRITASSKDYILGAPRMTDPKLDKDGLSYTDPGVDNKEMVSPAFMIASRLGFFYSAHVDLNPTSNSNALDVVRKHCANYVEVYKDSSGNPVHLYDWRLPTEEELKIIMNIQGKEGETAASIDYLLNAAYYYSASGPVYNDKTNSGYSETSQDRYKSTSVRCIRDAFTTVPDQTQIPGFSK